MHAVFCLVMAMSAGGALDTLPIKPPNQGGVYVVAHRGAHKNIPENTLAAYKEAIRLGADFVEIDVRTTKDGHFISMHNGKVDDYCADGTKGNVKDLTLAQIKALDIGSRVGPEWKDERVPTFEEILDLCKGKCGIYLDLKAAPCEPLAKEIQKRGMEHEVLWYTGPGVIKRLRAVCPECIGMPDPGPEENLVPLLESLQPKVVASTWRNYSKSFAETCHTCDAIVIVDESDASCWEEALAWKTDGIQTDDPEALIAFLKARKPDGKS